jgi:hypothetical protein
VLRKTDIHLSREEIAQLVEEADSAPRSPALGSSRELVDHAVGCVACGFQVRSQRAVQTNLNALVSFVASERSSGCPAEGKWLPLSAGALSNQEAALLLEHASTCDYCGRLLRETAEALGPEQSGQTREVVRQLASSNPEWQRKLAHRLSDLPQPAEGGSLVRAPSTSGRIRMQPMGSWARWALAGVGALLLALGSGLWIKNFRLSLSSTNQLIAQAYTEQRTVELRFPGASYGQLRQQRGEHISQRERPQALKDAKVQIARRLAQDPKDPNWLQAKARVDLLEGHFQAAIDTLQQVEAWHPDDSSLKVDLSTAYFERAEPTGQPADYAPALDLLNQVLSNNPNNPVAIFNRAIVYKRQHKYAQAVADWQHYLQVDPSGEWAAEADKWKEEAKTMQSE